MHRRVSKLLTTVLASIDCKLTWANSQEDNTFIHTRDVSESSEQSSSLDTCMNGTLKGNRPFIIIYQLSPVSCITKEKLEICRNSWTPVSIGWLNTDIQLMQKWNSFSDWFPLVEISHIFSSYQCIHVYTDLYRVLSSLEVVLKISSNANELSQI